MITRHVIEGSLTDWLLLPVVFAASLLIRGACVVTVLLAASAFFPLGFAAYLALRRIRPAWHFLAWCYPEMANPEYWYPDGDAY